MSNVIAFPTNQEQSFNPLCGEYAYLNGELVKKPKTGREYLELCKSKFTKEDYCKVLCGIMDLDFYSQLNKEFKNVVNVYFTFVEL